MKATTPLSPCEVAQQQVDAAGGHGLAQAGSPGWLASSTVNALILGPLSACPGTATNPDYLAGQQIPPARHPRTRATRR